MKPEVIGSSIAEIIKVSSNTDGSARLTVDLPEISTSLAAKLLEMKMDGSTYVHLTFVHTGDE